MTRRNDPLSLSLKSTNYAVEELKYAKAERLEGYMGRTAESVAEDMEQIINEVENSAKRI